MRKIKTIKIDNEEISVKELRVKDMLSILEKAKESDKDRSLNGFKTMIEENLPLACDVKMEALKDMAPSEIKEIVDAIREVNAVFFDTAQAMGLGGIIETLKESLKEDFMKMFSDSMKAAMPTPLNTALASS